MFIPENKFIVCLSKLNDAEETVGRVFKVQVFSRFYKTDENSHVKDAVNFTDLFPNPFIL